MSFFRLIIESLIHHRRLQAAVALGVAAATAVLTGALVVGDSVRGSLPRSGAGSLAAHRRSPGRAPLFRADLAGELSEQSEFRDHFAPAAPVALLEGTLENPSSHARATHVNILGIDDSFAGLSAGDPAEFAPPAPGQVYLNQPLADDLHLTAGQECIVRLPIAREVPADSALGRKTETITSLRLKIARIVPDRGLGRFALRPSQSLARDAFLNLADIQQALKQPGHVNAILVGHGPAAHDEDSPDALANHHDALQSLLRPTLADYGLTIRQAPLGYFVVESDRMILEPAAVGEAEKAFGPLGAQPAFTYLANTLADGEREIPYSTIAAIDFAAATPANGFLTPDGRPVAGLAADEIALNSWAAEDLGAKVGDTIRISYFEPESTHGARARKHRRVAAGGHRRSGRRRGRSESHSHAAGRDRSVVDRRLESAVSFRQPARPPARRRILESVQSHPQGVRFPGDRQQAVGQPFWQHHLAAHSGGRRAHRRLVGRAIQTRSAGPGIFVPAGERKSPPRRRRHDPFRGAIHRLQLFHHCRRADASGHPVSPGRGRPGRRNRPAVRAGWRCAAYAACC